MTTERAPWLRRAAAGRVVTSRALFQAWRDLGPARLLPPAADELNEVTFGGELADWSWPQRAPGRGGARGSLGEGRSRSETAAALALATGNRRRPSHSRWVGGSWAVSPASCASRTTGCLRRGLHNAGELALAGLAGEANGPTEPSVGRFQPLLEEIDEWVSLLLPSGLMDDELEPPSPPSAQQVADSVTSDAELLETLRCAQGDERRRSIPSSERSAGCCAAVLAPQLETLRAVLEVDDACRHRRPASTPPSPASSPLCTRRSARGISARSCPGLVRRARAFLSSFRRSASRLEVLPANS